MIDLLVFLGTRDNYEKYRSFVKDNILSKESKLIVKDMKEYYATHTCTGILWPAFASWFFAITHSTLKEDRVKIFQKIFDTLNGHTIDSELEEELVKSFLARSAATNIYRIAQDVAEGVTSDLSRVTTVMDGYHDELQDSASVDNHEAVWNISDIVRSTIGGTGLSWRLPPFNKSLGPIRKGNFIIIGARPDTGKCLAKGTPVLMYDGSTKAVEEVVVGDLLMGPDSRQRVAYGLTTGREAMYRIQYKNGEYYDVNESHILSLKRSKTEGMHKNGDILNVSVKEYLAWPQGRKARYKGWKTGVDFPYTPLAGDGYIDPYILGVWLGDGHSEGPTFTNADEGVWKAIHNYADNITRDGVDDYIVRYQASNNTGTAVTCRVTHGIKGKTNHMTRQLRDINVLNNKHIPKLYLTNSTGVRMGVLAGLLDTDGSVSKGCYEITQKRKGLSEDILYLARSLGYHATLREHPTRGVMYYRVYIAGDFTELNPYLQVEYKRITPNKKPKRKGLHFGFDVIPLGDGEYYGFAVDWDSLFMLGDFTVTHNTTMLASEATFMAPQLPKGKKVLWFNNEEACGAVQLRILQAALGANSEEIQHDELGSITAYNKLMGEENKIVLYDKADLTIRDVKEACKRHDVGLIVFDQLWKVQGVEDATNDVHKMTKLFNFGREMAKEYAPTITVHQADGSAGGKEYLTMEQLYMSKTGAQSEADAIIMIGRSYEPGKADSRFISVPKNKLTGGAGTIPSMRNIQVEVIIKPEIARFEEGDDI